MSIFGNTIKHINEFNTKRRGRLADRLLERTIDAEQKFIKEAKRFGVEAGSVNFRNYYDVLGIKYTKDPKAIRDAYIRLVKKYHPDVNRDPGAAQMTKDINEAYGILKDEKSKGDYDSRFSKGSTRISPEMMAALYNELMGRYNELRKRDFEEFNERVATPQYRDALKAAVEEAVDWNKRLVRASDMAFGEMRRYGRWLRKLEASSRDLSKKVGDDSRREKLGKNISRLDSLVQTYAEIERGMNAAVDRVRNDISTEENNIAGRLRSQVS